MPRTSTKSETAKAPRASKAKAAEPVPSLADALRRRAYELHLERGGTHGGDLDDWLRAEQEVQAQHQATTTGRKTTKRSG